MEEKFFTADSVNTENVHSFVFNWSTRLCVDALLWFILYFENWLKSLSCKKSCACERQRQQQQQASKSSENNEWKQNKKYWHAFRCGIPNKFDSV